MEHIKVSVIIPVYNHPAKYLTRCLASLKAQILQEIEFIIIDNGATTESKKIIEEYKSDTRFKVLHFTENIGYSKALNEGLKVANGEYIGFVDSDDYINEFMYNNLYEIAQKENVALVKSIYFEETKTKCNLSNRYGDNSKLNKKIYITDIPELLMQHASIWSGIYKKEMLDKYQIKFNEGDGAICKDIGFLLKTFICAEYIYVTSDAYYYYNIVNPNSNMKRQTQDKELFLLLTEYNLIEEWFSQNASKIDKDTAFNFILNRKAMNFCGFIRKYKKISYKNIKKIQKEITKQWFDKKYLKINDIQLLEFIISHPTRYYLLTRIRREKFKDNYKIIKYLGGIIKIKQNNKDKKIYILGIQIYTTNKYFNFIEKIFSIKNSPGANYKIIRLFGLKIKLSRRVTISQWINSFKELRNIPFNSVDTSWTAFGATDSLLQYLNLLGLSPYMRKYQNPQIWLIYMSCLLERGKYKELNYELKKYQSTHNLCLMENFIALSHYAYNNGYINNRIAMANYVYENLQKNKFKFADIIKNKKIAVVGNSDCELNKNKGEEIDAHDIVIRFGNFNIKNYTKDYGSKTDIWVRNADSKLKDRPYENFKLIFWAHDLVHYRLRIRQQLDSLYRDISCRKSVVIPDGENLFELRKTSAIDTPTSGLIILWEIYKILGNFKQVDIYGFSFLAKDYKNTSHYFDKKCMIGVDHNMRQEIDFLSELYFNNK